MSTFTKHCSSILRHVCNFLSVVWNYNMCTFYKKGLFINVIAVKKKLNYRVIVKFYITKLKLVLP